VSSATMHDDAVLEEPHRMEKLVAEAAEALADAPAEEIIRWATDTFGDRICITSSMTDAVIVHLASQIKPGIDVVFLDTGYHFAETIGTRDAVATVYPDIRIVNAEAEQSVADQEAEFGLLNRTAPDRCCHLRKVVPLRRTLGNYDAWVTGVRRVDAPTRANTPIVSWDDRNGLVKINPIAAWSDEEFRTYLSDHGVLENPLVAEGYLSIGCAPCTKPGAGREGRWAGTDKTECGLHVEIVEPR